MAVSVLTATIHAISTRSIAEADIEPVTRETGFGTVDCYDKAENCGNSRNQCSSGRPFYMIHESSSCISFLRPVTLLRRKGSRLDSESRRLQDCCGRDLFADPNWLFDSGDLRSPAGLLTAFTQLCQLNLRQDLFKLNKLVGLQ